MGAGLRKTWPYWGFLVVVLGAIWLIWLASAPESGPAGTSTDKSAVEKPGLQEQTAPADEGGASDDSWITFERILLLAAVAANYLLLVVVAWSYRRAGRLKVADMLSQQLQVIVAHLAAIEGALRTVSPKATTPPAPATPNPASGMKNYETPPEQPVLRPARLASEPVRRASVVQEPPSPPARREPIVESRRSTEGEAWNLARQYCLERGSSIVVLGLRATGLGLQVGSPSFVRGQRHVLDGPDQDSRLLAIKDRREERLFVVVSADSPVAESECLDLFEMPGFPGYCPVRTKRPATIDARTGEVEEKGELEVLSST